MYHSQRKNLPLRSHVNIRKGNIITKSVPHYQSLLIASHNKGKLVELQDLLSPLNINISSALDYNLSEPEETGTTFEANAILKAKDCLNQMQDLGHKDVACLADDSGFAVHALDGKPGIYSARYAMRDIEDEAGNITHKRDFAYGMQRLHDEWAASGSENNGAAFVCVLAIAFPNGEIKTFEGRCEGNLCWPPQGDKGFGYDPMFVPGGYTQSFAEMPSAEKQAISHRGKALAQMMAALF